ncbi:MAG: hypothetical protein ACC612_11315 [Methanomethylovorans sp.]|uniref:hypothetical protein n=1 Tax=Methanomethylovorans sp. TaxID=2758717 RepID=UPI00353074B0
MSWLVVGPEEIVIGFQNGRYLTNQGRTVSRPTPRNKHLNCAFDSATLPGAGAVPVLVGVV